MEVPAVAHLTDLPLICDDIFASVLQRLHVEAIVLSTDLLNLWRVRDLVDQDSMDVARLMTMMKQLPSAWRLNVSGQRLVQRPEYLVEMRLSRCNGENGAVDDNENSGGGVCLNAQSTWDEFIELKENSCEQPTSLMILPESRVKHFLFHHPTAAVLFVDLWHWFTNETVRNLPTVIFAFTSAAAYTCTEILREENRLTRSTVRFPFTSRESFHAWNFFLNNEALLADDKVYRFESVLGDPNDALYWRNLLAQLFKTVQRRRRIAKRDENICVVINLSFSEEEVEEMAMGNGGALFLLRFKRFLAFFSRVRKVLSEVMRSKKLAADTLKLFWSVVDRRRSTVYRLASWVREEALIAKSWRTLSNYDCFIGGDSGGGGGGDDGLPDVEIIGCSSSGGEKQRSGGGGGCGSGGGGSEQFNARADNVIGLVHDSLLLRGYYKQFSTSDKFLVANGHSVVRKHFSGAPLLKFR
jgi:hypothetical protein